MNPRRFDSLTLRLTNRVTRRTAFGAALAGGAVRPAARVAAQDAKTAANDRFLSIVAYPFEGDLDTARTELKPLLRLMQQQPGFITLAFLDDDTEIDLVMSFLDKKTSDAGMRVLEDWIATNDQTSLGEPSAQLSGASFLRSQLDAGCHCNVDDDDPCGTSDLVCCPIADTNRGLCMTAETVCPVLDDESDDDAPADPTATAIPAGGAACTHEGCSCVGGQPNQCDAGLSCCGAVSAGTLGTCMTTCPCGSEGCACVAAVVSTCDDGLICCAPGEIGGAGTCQYSCGCTSLGCSCTTGVDGTCDSDLVCCGIGSSDPGSIGVCLTGCSDAPCPGAEGCECGEVWKCNDGLICCGETDDGGTGICESECDA